MQEIPATSVSYRYFSLSDSLLKNIILSKNSVLMEYDGKMIYNLDKHA